LTPEQIKLLGLRTSGFKPLMAERIYLRCPRCGTKRSNMTRSDIDPEGAVLAELLCPRCTGGDFGGDTEYFDADGAHVVRTEHE